MGSVCRAFIEYARDDNVARRVHATHSHTRTGERETKENDESCGPKKENRTEREKQKNGTR